MFIYTSRCRRINVDQKARAAKHRLLITLKMLFISEYDKFYVYIGILKISVSLRDIRWNSMRMSMDLCVWVVNEATLIHPYRLLTTKEWSANEAEIDFCISNIAFLPSFPGPSYSICLKAWVVTASRCCKYPSCRQMPVKENNKKSWTLKHQARLLVVWVALMAQSAYKSHFMAARLWQLSLASGVGPASALWHVGEVCCECHCYF